MSGHRILDPCSFDFTGWAMPAEWDRHDATWLAWPKNTETWPAGLGPVREVYVRMIAALCPHEKVYVLLDGCECHEEFDRMTAGITTGRANIKPVSIPYNDSWMRDSGPIFLKSADGKGLVGQDFIFNTWGRKYGPWEDDDRIPLHATRMLDLPVVRHDLVLEGGSIEVNGRGTLLTTTQCLLNKNRNPHLSRAEIEVRLKRFLGLTHILWLEDGIEGDDTDGHIDDITRFTDPRTVVTVVEPDPADPNHAPLQANLETLRSMKDQDGRALRVVEIPMPKRRVEGPFGRSPASYANFYIANQVVLVPVYSDVNDQKVLDILQPLFPGRQVVGIECTPLVAGLGSIHCVTQQQPAKD
jgi:agmatine deiminase